MLEKTERTARDEIRYNAPDESAVANTLQQRLSGIGLNARLRESQQPTRWYVSVFICQ